MRGRTIREGALVGGVLAATEDRDGRAVAGEIALVDLAAEHAAVAAEVEAAAARVLRSGRYVLGEEVEAFEREWAAFAGAARAVGVASGTDALRLALQALGVAPGDEVVVPAMTFVATAFAAAQLGARVALADVDPETGQVRPDAVRHALGPRTRAVVAVHLYGHTAPVDEIAAICEAAGVALVEDCAQAHGARLDGRPVGTFGRAAAWSFYPTKNLGACGDGGAVTTADGALAERLAALRAHGQTRPQVHGTFGWNSRLDALQAAILRAKLPRLAAWNETRRRLGARYVERLGASGLAREVAVVAGGRGAALARESAWHLFVIRVPGGRERRDAVVARLRARGIGAGTHYPFAIHEHAGLAGALADGVAGARGAFPGAEALAASCVSLPLHPHMSERDVDRVADALAASLRG